MTPSVYHTMTWVLEAAYVCGTLIHDSQYWSYSFDIHLSHRYNWYDNICTGRFGISHDMTSLTWYIWYMIWYIWYMTWYILVYDKVDLVYHMIYHMVYLVHEKVDLVYHMVDLVYAFFDVFTRHIKHIILANVTLIAKFIISGLLFSITCFLCFYYMKHLYIHIAMDNVIWRIISSFVAVENLCGFCW